MTFHLLKLVNLLVIEDGLYEYLSADEVVVLGFSWETNNSLLFWFFWVDRVKVKLVQNLMSWGLGYRSTAGAAGRLVASWYNCPRLCPLNFVRPEIGPMSFFFFWDFSMVLKSYLPIFLVLPFSDLQKNARNYRSPHYQRKVWLPYYRSRMLVLFYIQVSFLSSWVSYFEYLCFVSYSMVSLRILILFDAKAFWFPCLFVLLLLFRRWTLKTRRMKMRAWVLTRRSYLWDVGLCWILIFKR